MDRQPLDYASPRPVSVRPLTITALATASLADLLFLAGIILSPPSKDLNFSRHFALSQAISTISLACGAVAIVVCPLAWMRRKSGPLETVALILAIVYWAAFLLLLAMGTL